MSENREIRYNEIEIKKQIRNELTQKLGTTEIEELVLMGEVDRMYSLKITNDQQLAIRAKQVATNVDSEAQMI